MLCSSLHGLSDLLVIDGRNHLPIMVKSLSLECSRVRDQLESVLVEGKVHAAAIRDSHLDGGRSWGWTWSCKWLAPRSSVHVGR
jgi:hypothetical protein